MRCMERKSVLHNANMDMRISVHRAMLNKRKGKKEQKRKRTERKFTQITTQSTNLKTKIQQRSK